MNPSIQSWTSLPDHLKSQAAVEMLSGAAWSYFGKTVERPRDSELTRWIPPPVCPARRTNADKRRDVLTTLKSMPRASAMAIARHTGTSHTFVSSIKECRRRIPKDKMAIAASSLTGEEFSICCPSFAFPAPNAARLLTHSQPPHNIQSCPQKST